MLERLVLKPLSHIRSNWELQWDQENFKYKEEDDSFASELNDLISAVSKCSPPRKYHENEDSIVKLLNIIEWPEQNPRGIWLTADYPHLLERGAIGDLNQENLIASISGRALAAISRGQMHFDDMDLAHMKIIASVMTIAIYYKDMYSTDPNGKPKNTGA